jgi:hypothetical protein
VLLVLAEYFRGYVQQSATIPSGAWLWNTTLACVFVKRPLYARCLQGFHGPPLREQRNRPEGTSAKKGTRPCTCAHIKRAGTCCNHGARLCHMRHRWVCTANVPTCDLSLAQLQPKQVQQGRLRYPFPNVRFPIPLAGFAGAGPANVPRGLSCTL